MQRSLTPTRHWIALAAFALLMSTAASQALHGHGGESSDDRWHASCVRCQAAPQTALQNGWVTCRFVDPSGITTAWVAEVPQVSLDTDLATRGIRPSGIGSPFC